MVILSLNDRSSCRTQRPVLATESLTSALCGTVQRPPNSKGEAKGRFWDGWLSSTIVSTVHIMPKVSDASRGQRM